MSIKKVKLTGVLIILLAFPLMAFTDSNQQVMYYHTLPLLKTASEPKDVKMILTRNPEGKIELKTGILVTYYNRSARNVAIAGNFSYWQEKKMARSDFGVWYYFIEAENDKSNFSYKFLVDNIWIADPLNSLKTDDQNGGYYSVAYSELKENPRFAKTKIKKNQLVEFKIYHPSAEFISVVGDFNHWNPENDLLERENDGMWHLTKKLPKGTYRYQFVVDGEWEVEQNNENSSTAIDGKVCSVITVK